jgi:hypothetical protein
MVSVYVFHLFRSFCFISVNFCLATAVQSSPRLKATTKKQTASRAISKSIPSAEVGDDSVEADPFNECSNYSDNDSDAVDASEEDDNGDTSHASTEYVDLDNKSDASKNNDESYDRFPVKDAESDDSDNEEADNTSEQNDDASQLESEGTNDEEDIESGRNDIKEESASGGSGIEEEMQSKDNDGEDILHSFGKMDKEQLPTVSVACAASTQQLQEFNYPPPLNAMLLGELFSALQRIGAGVQ